MLSVVTDSKVNATCPPKLPQILAGLLGLVLISVLVPMLAGCTSETDSMRTADDFYAELERIRDRKHQQLDQYMQMVKTSAETIANDTRMAQLFAAKNTHFKQFGSKDMSLAAHQERLEIRDQIENHYIEQYLMFSDLLFINAEGDIFYTIRRLGEYQTNIFDGPLADTELAQQLKQQPGVSFVDFHNYNIKDEPAAFFIVPAPDAMGWYVMQFPINNINNLFDIEAGLGQTGEVFLVNKDFYMLTDSRFLAESTILKQHLSEANISEKFRLRKGRKEVIDYRGHRAMTSFEVVDILGQEWLLITKIDQDEVITQLYQHDQKQLRNLLLSALDHQQHQYLHHKETIDTGVVVALDEFKRVANGDSIYTHGINTCTAVLVSYPGEFAYLAHISANDRIYGGTTTDLINQLKKRLDKFEVVTNEKRNLKITIVSPRGDYSLNVAEQFIDWGVLLSQVTIARDTEARYANLVHDYTNQQTLVEWKHYNQKGTRQEYLSGTPNLGDVLRPYLMLQQGQ